MKKILTTVFLVMVVMMASAQLLPGVAADNPSRLSLARVPKPQAQKQEMQAASTHPTVVTRTPKKTDGYTVPIYWKRPAGMFPGIEVLKHGANGGVYSMPVYFAKPYVDYEFTAVAEGLSNPVFSWEYQKSFPTADGWEHFMQSYEGNPLVVSYASGENNEVPTLIAGTPGDGDMYFYQPGGYDVSGTGDQPVVGNFHVSYVAVTPSNYDFFQEDDVFLMQSSKTFCPGGRHADQLYLMIYYSGAKPFGDNKAGWWFGKNAGRKGNLSVPINGIAQAFEKPTAPYLLRQVVLETTLLKVIDDVEMTCHVYKLPQGIPAYDAERSVGIYEKDFGEEIAYGRAELTPETNAQNDGLVVFTLYKEEDGLEYEVTPTIDDAIIITIDGYNDEGMENLKDFTASISSDIKSDEGYGELAYIKCGLTDDEGNFTGEYVWTGLNNFFSNGGTAVQMMTGLSIFIIADNPYLTYRYRGYEDSKYTFPAEGGDMEKPLHTQEYGDIVSRGIEFLSYVPSADEGWTLTCRGEQVPDWLSIQLTDGEENGEFDNSVLAEVTAEPLPAGVTYREAVVRFGFPGAYLDYKFMQGEKGDDFPKGDVNGDGDVNIADINALIAIILGGEDNTNGRSDVNGDGDVNIGDINAVIAIILGAE